MITFNQSSAAKYLGMKRQYLSYLLKSDGELGITDHDLMRWCLSLMDSKNKGHREEIAANDEIKTSLRAVQRLMDKGLV